jgi:hypothetical protein
MDAILAYPAQLLRDIIPRAVAYGVLKPVHKKRLSRPQARHQTKSALLKLPTEIRLMIYAYVFYPTPRDSEDWCRVRPILSTCRLMYQETIVLALQTTCFRFPRHQTGHYKPKRIRVLGALQQHLRHVEVMISLLNLDAHGRNNPFLLSNLPLDVLRITFLTPTHWTRSHDKKAYYRIISALLYRKRTLGKSHHRMAVATMQYMPGRQDLYDTLVEVKAKSVEVSCGSSSMILWNAFLHFHLVSQRITVIRAGKSGEKATKDYSFLDPNHREEEGSKATERSEIAFTKAQDMLQIKRALGRS